MSNQEHASKQASIKHQTLPTVSRAAYAALQAAKQAKRYRNRTINPARVLRAWGLIHTNQLEDRAAMYHTSLTSCDCIDWRDGHCCKHVIALMILRRAGKC